MEERVFHVLMKDLCSEMNINIEVLSYGWILQLSKDGKIKHITGNRFDINPEATGNIACDKYATYEVLKSQNIPVIEHSMIFNPSIRSVYIPDTGIWNDIISFFSKHGTIVIKPNNGCEGQGVYLCNTLKDIEIAIQQLFKNHGSLSMCPYYDIDTEYRTFYLNGECLLIYGKSKPCVVGNGVQSVSDLIAKLNLPNNNIVQENLHHIDLSYVPKLGEKYEISWKHNLSGGAIPTILEDCPLKEDISNLVKATGHAMNINFATIDVIQTTDKKLYVMEVNSGVCMTNFIEKIPNGYEIAKNIYRKSLDALFKS